MTTHMVRPGDLKPGMSVANYTVLSEPKTDVDGCVRIEVQFSDGGIDRRDWSADVAATKCVPVNTEEVTHA